MDFAWAKSPADHMVQYVDLVGSSQGRGVPAGMMDQMKQHASYIKTKLTPEEHAKLHKNISAHVDRLMKDDEISAEEADNIKSIYTPSRVDESKNVSHLQEKLSASDPASVWISHFVNSDDPKFSGKSKEQRKQMALGAYYAAKKGDNSMSEESKNLDESPSARKLAKGTGPRSDSYHKNLDTRIHRLMVGPMHPTAAPGPMNYDELRRRKRLNAGQQPDGPDRLKRHIKAARTERGGVVKDQDKGARLIAATGPTIRREESEMSFTAFRQKLDERVLSLLPKLPEETEGQHYCAKHVYSEVYGEGVVVEGQHAEPDDNGNIEWYTVQFDHGEEVIFTEDVEVMMAEYHNNHSSMKKKSKKAKE